MSRIDSEERIRDHRGIILKDGTERIAWRFLGRLPFLSLNSLPLANKNGNSNWLWPTKRERGIDQLAIPDRRQSAMAMVSANNKPFPAASLPRSFYSPCLARRLWKGGKAIPDRIFTSKKCSFIAAENRKDAGVFVYARQGGTDQTKPSIWYCYLNWIWLRIVLRRFPNTANHVS